MVSVNVKTVTSRECAVRVGVSLHSDIATYWPHMKTTAFYAVFVDPCGSVFTMMSPGYAKKKMRRKNCSIFSTSLSCKHPQVPSGFLDKELKMFKF